MAQVFQMVGKISTLTFSCDVISDVTKPLIGIMYNLILIQIKSSFVVLKQHTGLYFPQKISHKVPDVPLLRAVAMVTYVDLSYNNQ